MPRNNLLQGLGGPSEVSGGVHALRTGTTPARADTSIVDAVRQAMPGVSAKLKQDIVVDREKELAQARAAAESLRVNPEDLAAVLSGSDGQRRGVLEGLVNDGLLHAEDNPYMDLALQEVRGEVRADAVYKGLVERLEKGEHLYTKGEHDLIPGSDPNEILKEVLAEVGVPNNGIASAAFDRHLEQAKAAAHAAVQARSRQAVAQTVAMRQDSIAAIVQSLATQGDEGLKSQSLQQISYLAAQIRNVSPTKVREHTMEGIVAGIRMQAERDPEVALGVLDELAGLTNGLELNGVKIGDAKNSFNTAATVGALRAELEEAAERDLAKQDRKYRTELVDYTDRYLEMYLDGAAGGDPEEAYRATMNALSNDPSIKDSAFPGKLALEVRRALQSSISTAQEDPVMEDLAFKELATAQTKEDLDSLENLVRGSMRSLSAEGVSRLMSGIKERRTVVETRAMQDPTVKQIVSTLDALPRNMEGEGFRILSNDHTSMHADLSDLVADHSGSGRLDSRAMASDPRYKELKTRALGFRRDALRAESDLNEAMRVDINNLMDPEAFNAKWSGKVSASELAKRTQEAAGAYQYAAELLNPQGPMAVAGNVIMNSASSLGNDVFQHVSAEGVRAVDEFIKANPGLSKKDMLIGTNTARLQAQQEALTASLTVTESLDTSYDQDSTQGVTVASGASYVWDKMKPRGILEDGAELGWFEVSEEVLEDAASRIRIAMELTQSVDPLGSVAGQLPGAKWKKLREDLLTLSKDNPEYQTTMAVSGMFRPEYITEGNIKFRGRDERVKLDLSKIPPMVTPLFEREAQIQKFVDKNGTILDNWFRKSGLVPEGVPEEVLLPILRKRFITAQTRMLTRRQY